MNILAVDDNKYALETLTKELKSARPDDVIYSFGLPSKVIDFIDYECKELFSAFLDVEMPGMSGIELAAIIKKKFPHVIIIFVTAYPNYSLDAFKVHANGYLVKPVTDEMLRRELSEIAQPFINVALGRVYAHTFGNFELYVDKKPVKFTRSKTKELFAFLIDRHGALCNMNEIAAVLFEEDGDIKAQQSYIRQLISDMKSTLKSLNADYIIRKERNAIAVNTESIDCDYYRFLKGEPAAVNEFLGEYMTNYGWSEFTVGNMINKIEH